jgi:hypothetical protein
MKVGSGKEHSLNLFFEAGSQTWAPFNTTMHGRKRSEAIFRTGVGYSFKRVSSKSVRPVEIHIGALGWKGLWNVGMGTEQPGTHAPQYLPTYVQYLQAIKGRTAWGIMFTLTIRH